MNLTPQPGLANAASKALPVAPATSSALLIVLAVLAPFILYFPTAASIVAIWNSSETFAHGYVIIPICLWLIWRRREVFAAIPAQPWAPALALLAIAGLGWLLARLGDVQFVMQYAFAAMIPLAALAMLGLRLGGALAFPLAFIMLAVPFGEVFVEPLIKLTADFTVWAVQATGIPVLRNGTRFELPTGHWSVVEACSGVRYLISSFTLGCLYAYLTYRSLGKRLAFVAVSIVVPIIANGLRAYMIVMIGHLSGMELATGVDHLIYGWVFFGLVMLLMFWVGGFWRDDDAAPLSQSSAAQQAQFANAGQASTSRMLTMCVAVIAVCAIWPALARYSDSANANPRPVQLVSVTSNWAPTTPFTAWSARYANPSAKLRSTYQGPLAPVMLEVFYYRDQRVGKALISSTNMLAAPDEAWHALGSNVRTETVGSHSVTLRETRLRGPTGIILVWQWMNIDGQTSASNMVGKLLQAQTRLRQHGDDGAAILVSTPAKEDLEPARTTLRAFLASHGNAIDSMLTHARAN